MEQSRKPARHEDANREAARRILAERERYGGEGGLMVEWAKRVAAKGGAL